MWTRRSSNYKFHRGDYTRAYIHYQKCEEKLNTPAFNNTSYWAHLQHAYCNLGIVQGHVQGQLNNAIKAFTRARQLSQDMAPVSPLTVAAYYKLACIESKQNHHKKALKYLSKALKIAEVMSSGVINGTIARTLWKKAEVMQQDPLADHRSVAQLMADIESSQKTIADELGVDITLVEGEADREKSFDLLVPGYFR